MANRSYLYSIDSPPDREKKQRRITGLSEWAYDVPLAFKLLLSANPRACKSVIWDTDDEIAIVGEYERGLGALNAFLSRLADERLEIAAKEAMEFLGAPANRQSCFLLECGELFEMSDEDLSQQNRILLEEIQNIDAHTDRFLAEHRRREASLFGRWFGKKATGGGDKSSQKLINAVGLGNWSNHLYFDFSQSQISGENRTT